MNSSALQKWLYSSGSIFLEERKNVRSVNWFEGRIDQMFSVIIPAYNAEKLLPACLSALLNQSVDASGYEIIVVDDGSSDNTSEIVKGFKSVRLLRQKNQGPAAARNEGVKHAKGNIILFTDSDCVPNGDWVEQMILPFKRNNDIAGVKGTYKTKQRSLAARFVQIEYEDKYDLLRKTEYIDFIDTYSAAFKKNVFVEFGGYDTSFPLACAEDVELSFRMSSKGYKMVYNPRAIVFHTHPSSFGSYFTKKYKFAYWRMLAVKKNPGKFAKDSHTPQIMKFQVLFLPAIAVLLLLSIFMNIAGWLIFFVIAAFFLSTIPFTAKAFGKDKVVGFLSPLILAGRSIYQFFGVLNGSARAFLLEK